jgi:general secretion pathway protein C
MVSNLQSRWAVGGSTFVLWALVAASAIHWGLKLTSPAGTRLAPPALRSSVPVDPIAVARLMGSSPVAAVGTPAPSVASRLTLVGVVAARAHDGAALIGVDGKPAKPFRVGSPVVEGLLLQAVEPRRALLAPSMDAPAVVTLDLPLLRKQ